MPPSVEPFIGKTPRPLRSWGALLLAPMVLTGLSGAGEILYNGIRLPDQWPPKRPPLRREPMPVPYLENRPALVPIDIGRQLFVDDFLIDETTLKRVFHLPEYQPDNPVLKPDQPWESARVNIPPATIPHLGDAPDTGFGDLRRTAKSATLPVERQRAIPRHAA